MKADKKDKTEKDDGVAKVKPGKTEKSTKQNSMAPGGEFPEGASTDAGEHEFEENRSEELRMKPQPLKKGK